MTGFENRPSGSDTGGALGGEVRGSSFFRGDVGVFGGVRYRISPRMVCVSRA